MKTVLRPANSSVEPPAPFAGTLQATIIQTAPPGLRPIRLYFPKTANARPAEEIEHAGGTNKK